MTDDPGQVVLAVALDALDLVIDLFVFHVQGQVWILVSLERVGLSRTWNVNDLLVNPLNPRIGLG